ncbi:MAG: RNase adapter RapZ [Roseovarius sp.]|nr:RNase adapter RapZ [uncultured Roseovarius sp.]MDX1784554.1 RNase adapter RapZ [Roseovarius sp.]
MSQTQSAPSLVLVTGPSGAGRTTAIRALEDMGYEAIDNLPLSLLPRLMGDPIPTRPLALGVDARNRDFSTHALIEAIDQLDRIADRKMQLLYIDCSAEVLLRRFSETRRRHPLAPDESARAGIEREFDLLGPIRARADLLIDTSELSPHELRAALTDWFGPTTGRALAVSVHSFSYKRGLPRSADLVLDCRFLRNPYWQPSLRALDGRDPEVAAYVAGDPLCEPFKAKLLDLVQLLLPAYEAEGKSYLSIALGCTGGQHRSVAIAESLTAALAEAGWQVSTRHRELERRAAGSSDNPKDTGGR